MLTFIVLARSMAARLNIRSERGASGVEYGIMIALIAAVIILAVVFLGEETSGSFSCTGDKIATRGANPC